jgi:hypothetical protein
MTSHAIATNVSVMAVILPLNDTMVPCAAMTSAAQRNGTAKIATTSFCSNESM